MAGSLTTETTNYTPVLYFTTNNFMFIYQLHKSDHYLCIFFNWMRNFVFWQSDPNIVKTIAPYPLSPWSIIKYILMCSKANSILELLYLVNLPRNYLVTLSYINVFEIKTSCK